MTVETAGPARPDRAPEAAGPAAPVDHARLEAVRPGPAVRQGPGRGPLRGRARRMRGGRQRSAPRLASVPGWHRRVGKSAVAVRPLPPVGSRQPGRVVPAWVPGPFDGRTPMTRPSHHGPAAQQCGSKRTHRSKGDAKRAARRVETTLGSGRLEVYRCPHCARWHVGHPPSRRRPL